MLSDHEIQTALFCTSGEPNLIFSQITTDSRKIAKGCLFIAIVGEKMDGHDFIAEAIEKGALGILIQKDINSSINLNQIKIYRTTDSVNAFRKIMKTYKQKFKIPFICVAGSVGKTTTKDMIFSILKGKYKSPLKTQGSQNGFLGIPITLSELKNTTDCAVIEVGIDDIGAMKKHIELLSPEVSILTAIGPEHLENLKDLKTVAHEESLALTMTHEKNHLVIINMDDAYISPLNKEIKTNKILFGLDPVSDPSPHLLGEYHEDTQELEIISKNEDVLMLPILSFTVKVPLAGKHNARNLLGAISCAWGLGLNQNDILKGLQLFEGSEGRSQIRETSSGFVVLCDYYNANPTSMFAAFQTIKNLKNKTPKASTFICIADMLELGADEKKLHCVLATELKENTYQHIFLFGEKMKWLHEELKKVGKVAFHFDNKKSLVDSLLSKAKAGDLILIKGSRSMKMEDVWKLIEKA